MAPPQAKIHNPAAFLDHDYEAGDAFRLMWLRSPDFKVAALSQLAAPGTRSLAKDDLASLIDERIKRGRVSPLEVLRVLCRQTRTWMAVRKGVPTGPWQALDPKRLLVERGRDQSWYGPIEDGESSWYIWAKLEDHWMPRGDENSSSVVRWLLFARIYKSHVVYSWEGFGRIPDEEWLFRAPLQFPYWQYVPGAMNFLERHLGGAWSKLALEHVVLKTMWDKYVPDDQNYLWRDISVRASSEGVALAAKSSGAVTEIGGHGLRTFSHRLAETAVKALEIPTAERPPKIALIERATRRMLIHEWGTRSYEFFLHQYVGGVEKYIFRAHCYFGKSPEDDGPDVFEHMKCYITAYGGSTDLHRFLVRELSLT